LSKWRDCIVVFIDLIGIKKRAALGDSKASALMRSFHNKVRQEMRNSLSTLDHAYVWNDSVILLAYVDQGPRAYERALLDADSLKRKIDASSSVSSYAITVKGQAFPVTPTVDTNRVTVIQASSYAMANCFEVDAKIKKKKLRKSWYVDTRIVREIEHLKSSEWIVVPFLPTGRRRRVYLYTGYLWGKVGV
jgi:hypothetical protein